MANRRRDIPPEERPIVALDVPDVDQAISLVEQLGESVHFYKIGLELMMAGRYFDLLKHLVAVGKKVFVDLKLYDVPQTVGAAVARLAETGATFATVHGNEEILKAAVAARCGSLEILAVTVLTSLDETDIRAMGFECSVEELVLHRAQRALACGCDGTISSPLEAKKIREKFGDGLLIVTPGIRQAGCAGDDQKRTADVETAFRNGADYIVVGRPIRNTPNPRATAEEFRRTIANAVAYPL